MKTTESGKNPLAERVDHMKTTESGKNPLAERVDHAKSGVTDMEIPSHASPLEEALRPPEPSSVLRLGLIGMLFAASVAILPLPGFLGSVLQYGARLAWAYWTYIEVSRHGRLPLEWFVVTGLASIASVLAFFDIVEPVQVIAASVGVLLTGIALMRRADLPLAWAIAAVTCLIASFGYPSSWDSGPRVTYVMAVVGLIATGLALMPTRMRWITVTILPLLHFSGIMTAVTGPPPQPYLSEQMWARIYRPYLQFMYLNNAYQFYSPEPGSAVQLWACIKYKTEDKNRRFKWFRMPVRPEQVRDPLGLTYFRRLALTERFNAPNNAAESPAEMDQIRQRRELRRDIPHHPQLTESQEYRAPTNEFRRLVLPSYARHLIHANQVSDLEVESILLYRVDHRIVLPGSISQGFSVFDPSWYVPVFYGEFDAAGILLDAKEPMLYWVVPILYRGVTPAMGELKPGKLLDFDMSDYADFVQIHAGSNHGVFQK